MHRVSRSRYHTCQKPFSDTNWVDIAQATVAANRIVDLRSTKDDDSQLSSLVRGDLGQGDKGVKLEFNNVWFRYPTRDAPVLNGLDLTVRSYAVKLKHKQSTCLVLIANSQVEKGQFAAVVGPSGMYPGKKRPCTSGTDNCDRVGENNGHFAAGKVRTPAQISTIRKKLLTPQQVLQRNHRKHIVQRRGNISSLPARLP